MNLPIPNQQAYRNAEPFPHCVIDDAFDPDELRDILLHWPVKHEHYSRSGDQYEVSKGATMSEGVMGDRISGFIRTNFQSQRFIAFLEAMTGITGLVIDAKKFALHEVFNGGLLMPHLDYTINKATGLQLRINVILYLNENWKSEYGGNLELYESRPMYGGTLNKAVVSVEPIFNRLVIFTMDAEKPAWHGNPYPIKAPEGVSRRSIAANYFTIPQKTAVDQRTTFSTERKSILKDLLPPIIYRIIRK